jgi:hypothetical protein
MDWVWGGADTTSFNCYTYGCDPWTGSPGDTYQRYVHNVFDKGRFMVWLMQNMPGMNNTSRGRDGNYRPNWWAIKFK